MKKLIYFLIPLFLFIPKVNADIINSKFMGKIDNAVVKEGFSAGELYTYKNQYVTVDDTRDVFFGYTFCATGSYQFTIPYDHTGSTAPIGVYDSGVRCNLDQDNYYGIAYTFYFMALQWGDAGGGNKSIMFNLSVKNPESYHSLITGYGVFVADYIPASVQYQRDYDNSFNSLKSSLNQIESQNNTLNSNQQQILHQQQAIIAEQENTTNAVNDVNDTLKDDTVDNSSLNIDDKSADLGDSPVSDLITLPIKLLTNIYNGFSGSCVSYNLGSLFGTDLIFPCINLESIFGSFLWGLIDSLCCIFLIYKIAMLFVSMWTKIITMKDVFTSIYTPGGGN